MPEALPAGMPIAFPRVSSAGRVEQMRVSVVRVWFLWLANALSRRLAAPAISRHHRHRPLQILAASSFPGSIISGSTEALGCWRWYLCWG